MDEAVVWPFLIGVTYHIRSTRERVISPSRSMCRRISPIFSLLLPSLHRIPGACIDTLGIVLLRKPDFDGSILPVNVC